MWRLIFHVSCPPPPLSEVSGSATATCKNATIINRISIGFYFRDMIRVFRILSFSTLLSWHLEPRCQKPEYFFLPSFLWMNWDFEPFFPENEPRSCDLPLPEAILLYFQFFVVVIQWLGWLAVFKKEYYKLCKFFWQIDPSSHGRSHTCCYL